MKRATGAFGRMSFGRAALAGTTAFWVLALPAQAQTASKDNSDQLQEVVVTATKRPELLKDVPLSVQALTADALERTNTRDFTDLPNIAPSLTISASGTAANTSINLRGIGTYSFSVAYQPSVAVVVDDIPQASALQAMTSLGQLARIEVLNGPQSTLFGKSADAGVVNITTPDPAARFRATGDFLATGDHEERGQATLSGPIGDTLGLFVNAGDSNYRGNVFNQKTGNWGNGSNSKNISAKLVWQPTDDWTVTLLPNIAHTLATPNTAVLYSVTPGTTIFSKSPAGYPAIPKALQNQNVFSTVLAGIAPGPSNRTLAQNTDQYSETMTWGTGLKIAHELADGTTLASITSYTHLNDKDSSDNDQTGYNYALLFPTLANLAPGGSVTAAHSNYDNTTQDFRITSPSNQNYRYVAGIFISDQRGDRPWLRTNDILTSAGVVTSTAATGGPVNTGPTGDTYYSYRSRAVLDTQALYGHMTIDLTDQLSVEGGLRLHHEADRYEFDDRTNNLIYGDPSCASKTPSGYTASTCNDNTVVVKDAAIKYKVTPDVTGFVHVATGYKGFAYDLSSAMDVRAPLTVGPYKGIPTADYIATQEPIAAETDINYETGFKGDFFNRRVSWNAEAFLENFKDYQSSYINPDTGLNELHTIPKVSSKGFSTNITAKPIRELTLSANGMYDVAQSNSYAGAPCYNSGAPGCVKNPLTGASNTNQSGRPLANAPRFNANLNAEYLTEITDDYSAFFGASYRFRSAAYLTPTLDPDSIQKAYSITNLQTGVAGENWKITLFCNNVFDKNYATAKSSFGKYNTSRYPASGAASDAVIFVPGRDADRYVGIRLTYSYE